MQPFDLPQLSSPKWQPSAGLSGDPQIDPTWSSGVLSVALLLGLWCNQPARCAVHGHWCWRSRTYFTPSIRWNVFVKSKSGHAPDLLFPGEFSRWDFLRIRPSLGLVYSGKSTVCLLEWGKSKPNCLDPPAAGTMGSLWPVGCTSGVNVLKLVANIKNLGDLL